MDGQTTGFGKMDEHFWLCRSVARVMGINLSERMAQGRLSPEDLAEIVACCRAGGCAPLCKAWLANQALRPGKAPRHCAVAHILDRLI